MNDSFNKDIEKYIERLEKCEYISEKEVKFLCEKAIEQLSKEENVIYLNAPITVNKIFIIKLLSIILFTPFFY